MRIITIIYIFSYLLHIFLGPYFYRFIISGEKIKHISKNWKDVVAKMFFITYINFLSIAYFNENPNTETFLISFSLSLASTIGFYVKFSNDKSFRVGMIDHVLYLIIPSIYLFFQHKINLLEYKPTMLTLITIIYFLTFRYYDQIIYQVGKDL